MGGSGKVDGSYFLGFRVRDLKANPACKQPSQHANVLLHTRRKKNIEIACYHSFCDSAGVVRTQSLASDMNYSVAI